jgi:uncharacterized DUF497 family protein
MVADQAFEWGTDAKAASNLAKHGVRFDFAVRVFAEPACIDLDVSRTVDGERRRKAIAMIDGRLFTVVYTKRHGVIRIISARRANARESRAYGTIYP